ncbi:uncharacterized protein [Procambarus clarkii]|uniref:uncharacterized protein n=1 Tax=Procambarus clarkii TaxID=6728 RepID=UPI0037438807
MWTGVTAVVVVVLTATAPGHHVKGSGDTEDASAGWDDSAVNEMNRNKEEYDIYAEDGNGNHEEWRDELGRRVNSVLDPYSPPNDIPELPDTPSYSLPSNPQSFALLTNEKQFFPSFTNTYMTLLTKPELSSRTKRSLNKLKGEDLIPSRVKSKRDISSQTGEPDKYMSVSGTLNNNGSPAPSSDLHMQLKSLNKLGDQSMYKYVLPIIGVSGTTTITNPSYPGRPPTDMIMSPSSGSPTLRLNGQLSLPSNTGKYMIPVDANLLQNILRLSMPSIEGTYTSLGGGHHISTILKPNISSTLGINMPNMLLSGSPVLYTTDKPFLPSGTDTSMAPLEPKELPIISKPSLQITEGALRPLIGTPTISIIENPSFTAGPGTYMPKMPSSGSPTLGISEQLSFPSYTDTYMVPYDANLLQNILGPRVPSTEGATSPLVGSHQISTILKPILSSTLGINLPKVPLSGSPSLGINEKLSLPSYTDTHIEPFDANLLQNILGPRVPSTEGSTSPLVGGHQISTILKPNLSNTLDINLLQNLLGPSVPSGEGTTTPLVGGLQISPILKPNPLSTAKLLGSPAIYTADKLSLPSGTDTFMAPQKTSELLIISKPNLQRTEGAFRPLIVAPVVSTIENHSLPFGLGIYMPKMPLSGSPSLGINEKLSLPSYTNSYTVPFDANLLQNNVGSSVSSTEGTYTPLVGGNHISTIMKSNISSTPGINMPNMLLSGSPALHTTDKPSLPSGTDTSMAPLQASELPINSKQSLQISEGASRL